MNFVDTHCHIHTSGYKLDARQELMTAENHGVGKVIVVGEGSQDCTDATEFAIRNNIHAAVGIHPHMADKNGSEIAYIKKLAEDSEKNKIVAIGECGLDYYYLNSPKQPQEKIFRQQIDLAIEANLPLIFHVRGSKQQPEDAFEDFFSIVDGYNGLRGVVHSFGSNWSDAEKILERGFYIGLNGIITFAGEEELDEAIRKIPLKNILLETDSPYLTPVPFRGKINTPQYVVKVGERLAKLKDESLDKVADVTTINASELFGI